MLLLESSRRVLLIVMDQASLAEGEEVTSEEEAWYLRRLEGGLFTLQTVDFILAWIIMEDDGVRLLSSTSPVAITDEPIT